MTRTRWYWKKKWGGGKIISRISVDSNFTFTSYAWSWVFHCSIDYCVELIIVDDNFCEDCSHFILKWFQPNSFGEICFLEKSYKHVQKKKKKKNENFDSTLYMKSRSIYTFNYPSKGRRVNLVGTNRVKRGNLPFKPFYYRIWRGVIVPLDFFVSLVWQGICCCVWCLFHKNLYHAHDYVIAEQ